MHAIDKNSIPNTSSFMPHLKHLESPFNDKIRA